MVYWKKKEEKGGSYEKAKREIDLKDRYDYVVLNDDVERAALEIKEIIRARIKENM